MQKPKTKLTIYFDILENSKEFETVREDTKKSENDRKNIRESERIREITKKSGQI